MSLIQENICFYFVESYQDAVKREVKEEAGMDFEADTLISVEITTGYWYRFTFTGKVTGKFLLTNCWHLNQDTFIKDLLRLYK